VLRLLFALSSIEFMQRGITEEALLVSLSSPLMVLNAVDAGVNHQSVQRQDAHISKRIIDLLPPQNLPDVHLSGVGQHSLF
jgi:hypothetical protein